jgi:heme-degrading monooxygenase HmoA
MFGILWIGIAIPGNNDKMEKAAEYGPELFKGAKGFKSAVYFSDKAKNEYGMFTIWDAEENAKAFTDSKSSYFTEATKSFAGTLFEQHDFFINNFFSSK